MPIEAIKLGVSLYLIMLIRQPMKIVKKFIMFRMPVCLVIVREPIQNHCPNTIGSPVTNIAISSSVLVAVLSKKGYAIDPENNKAHPNIKFIWKVLALALLVITMPNAHKAMAIRNTILNNAIILGSFVIQFWNLE